MGASLEEMTHLPGEALAAAAVGELLQGLHHRRVLAGTLRHQHVVHVALVTRTEYWLELRGEGEEASL